jgi:hypothetical protein
MSERFKHQAKYSDDKFDYHTPLTDTRIGFLKDHIRETNKQLKILESQINAIYDDCEHDFKFISQGAYDDTYRCIHCGYETEK